MDKLILFLLIEWIWVTLPGSSQAASQTPPFPGNSPTPMTASLPMKPALPGNKLDPATAIKSVPAYQLYTYYGDRYRDPFIPLEGSEVRSDLTSDRPPQIASLQLKGIIQDTKGRIALLTSGVSSYVLRGGRLYDGRNHMMKGISGVIKTNSVILIGSDRTVRELKVSVPL